MGLRPKPRLLALLSALVPGPVSAAACHPQPGTPAVAAPAAPAAARYEALGSGHLLRGVSENGRFVTLEDGSRWEIHPRDRFRTIDWELESGISVRTTQTDEGYGYEIVNTSIDDGALARVQPNHLPGKPRQIPNPESLITNPIRIQTAPMASAAQPTRKARPPNGVTMPNIVVPVRASA